MREIPLTRGYVALVDDADFDRIREHRWRSLVPASKHTVYAVRSVGPMNSRRNIYMHREIAAVTSHGKRSALGRFASEVEAARAYDEAARRIFGEFAATNF